ncbi:SCO7613 C-terminal domain-containing membrane protein [Dactylosporangium sp. NPDC051541]|uniref:SCO7613 C-terminal domain-containing membrane protein n=1 Tax=Dactylosporangium sp. NPDC051541 TaxID=3363977 RepID=UPI003789569D
MVSYPCPFCGAPAGLESGCGGCGRPPFPDAAEVVRLNGETRQLYSEVEAARTRLGSAVLRYNEAVSRRNLLAARIKAAVATAATRTPALPPPTPSTPAPGQAAMPVAVPVPAVAVPVATPAAMPVDGGFERRPEAEPRTVQNLLFILGGLLLGAAAIVFTAVAWASFGVLGRAAILAVITLLTLAVPPLVQRRGLRATAETFAALGILLVALDGYAAWYVNLAGLAGATIPTTYAGLTFTVTAGIAGAYAALTRLRAPRLAAVLAIQPVLPLLALHRGFGATGWALVFVGVAAIGLLLARTVEPVAWFAAGAAVLATLPPALHALATVDGVAAALRIAAVMVLLAALVVAAGAMHPATTHPAAGVATGILALAGARLVAEVFPQQRYAAFAVLALLFVAAASVIPERFRRGTRIGALVVTAVFAAPYVAFALLAAVRSALHALPPWHPVPAAAGRLFSWPEPAALTILAVAFWLAVRHRAVPWTALLLLTFAAPAAFTASSPATAVIADAAALVVMAVVVVRRPVDAAPPATAAAFGHGAIALVAMPLVGAHLAIAGLVTPAATLVSYAVLGALSALVAVRVDVRGVSLPAAVVALLSLPVLGAAAFRLPSLGTATSGPLPPALAGATAGLALVVTAAIVLRNRAWNVGTIATATAGAGVTIAALAQSAANGGVTWFGPYGAAVLLATWLAARAFRPPAGPSTPGRDLSGWRAEGSGAGTRHVVAAVVPVLAVAASLLPAVLEALLRPLSWLGSVWAGAPGGVGLGPDGTAWWERQPPALGAGASAVTLAVLAVLAVLVAGRFGWSRWTLAAPPVLLGSVLGCVAIGAPWPVVPAVTLAGGLVTALGAGLRKPSPGTAVGAVTGWFGIVPGLAGCLAASWSTIAGLGLIVAAGIVVGIAGRAVAARVIAWLVAGAAGGWLAFAAGQAADLPLRTTAYLVLAVAGLALAGGHLVRRGAANPGEPSRPAAMSRTGEGRVLDAVAHAVAVVAFLLAVADLAAGAGVAGLWGVALGLRALSGPPRTGYAVGAVLAELVAYELVLASRAVSVTEAYTVPVALAALAAGWFAARRSATLTSWVAFGPALLFGFLPSLALVTALDGEPVRRLLLGAAAVAVVLAGARFRLKAPIAAGGVVLAVLAWHEVLLFWDYLPRWAPLALAGALLVGFAVTYERRLRDLGRIRAAMGRMR